MTDTEAICEWMEPKPTEEDVNDPVALCGHSPLRWWAWHDDYERGEQVTEPCDLTLDRLHEVEECILSQGWQFRYSNLLMQLRGDEEVFWGWHATAAQKIRALAAVIRERP